MSATLRDLLAEPGFHLRAVCIPDPSALDREIVWAHSSDLADPTPWMEAGQLLLTDGMQFLTDDDHDAYVARLRACDVAALGFATEVIHADVPPGLVRACERQQLALLEVAQRAPFIGIIRFVADQRALEQRARLEWSLQAQRKLARAALKPGGLGEILVELERQLDSWVALYDSTGVRVAAPTSIPVPGRIAADIERLVAELLAKGGRSGARLQGDAGDVTLQTVGQHGQLRGVLAVGGRAPLDLAGNDLVASAIGHASIALEQNRALDAANRYLRVGLLELLLAGETAVAARTAEAAWGALPEDPILAIVVPVEQPAQALLDRLERFAGEADDALFFADRGDELVVVVPAGQDARIRSAVDEAGHVGGASAAGSWEELPRLVTEARKAARHASAARTFVSFEEIAATGMLGVLDAAGGRLTAERVLHPLLDGGAHGRMLLATLRAWTAGNCAWDPVAKTLGIHRHTLRSRVSAAEQLLGVDLQTFAGRAEVWAAMQLVED